jgi:hypothetical protein
MNEKAKLCLELQKQGLTYKQISGRTELSPTLVNYYLHYERRKEYQRRYRRLHLNHYVKVEHPTPPPQGRELGSRFMLFEERHNTILNRLNQTLNGKVFHRAPFDFATNNGEFYEIKVTSWRKDRSNCRFRLTEEELKFMEIVKNAYHVILCVLKDDTENIYVIDYPLLSEWNKHTNSFQKGIGDKYMKTFELSKKRLSLLKPFEISKTAQLYLW